MSANLKQDIAINPESNPSELTKMTFLTIFSTPKPFTEPHINIIQRNAIKSWQQLGQDVEVILVGEEEGMDQIVKEFGVKHLPNVERNELGTPLVSSIFRLARDASTSPFLAYVNADILLFPGFLLVARQVAQQSSHFLILGQRWDVNVEELINFDEDWVARMRARVNRHGKYHAPSGSDYFIFPRDAFTEIPDFGQVERSDSQALKLCQCFRQIASKALRHSILGHAGGVIRCSRHLHRSRACCWSSFNQFRASSGVMRAISARRSLSSRVFSGRSNRCSCTAPRAGSDVSAFLPESSARW